MAKREAMVLAFVALGGLFAACGGGDGEVPGFLQDGDETASPAGGDEDTPTSTASAEGSGGSPTSTPGGPIEYAIQPGDTLFDIAIRFDTTVLAIVELNGIVDPAVIQPGDIVLIPQ